MSVLNDAKVVVSVAEMARMCGLSRSRFYQLIGTAFPEPQRHPETGRPIYTEELQQVCLEVRRRNCGIDGKPILFYARRLGTAPAKPKPPKPKLNARRGDVLGLIAGLNGLGMTTATAAEVQRVTEELYPNGTAGLDQEVVLKEVFLEIRSRNSGDKVGK